MFELLKSYFKSEDGAVTVDWVVLTAAVIGMALAGMAATNSGVMSLSGKIASNVSAVPVAVTP